MTEKIVEKLVGILGKFLSKHLIVFIVSMFPILELRGGLLAAAALKINPVESYIICVIGNFIPIPFILLLIKSIIKKMLESKIKLFNSFASWLHKKSDKNKAQIEKYGADELFEDRLAILRWQWIAGRNAPERRFDEEAVREAHSGADLVGHLNYVHPYRVQIVGAREISYLTRGTPEDCARRVARIVTLQPPVLVLCDGQTAPPALVTLYEKAKIPLSVHGELPPQAAGLSESQGR